MFLLIFVACGSAETERIIDYPAHATFIEQVQEYSSHLSSVAPEILELLISPDRATLQSAADATADRRAALSGAALSGAVLLELTREQFLEDFDFLMDTLEATFPSLGIIYHRYGVDMLELGQELRLKLESDDFRHGHLHFWTLLQEQFFPYANSVGHLWLLPYSSFSQFSITGTTSPNSAATYNHFRHLLRPMQSTRPTQQLNGTRFSFNILKEGHIAYIRFPQSMDQDSMDALSLRIDAFFEQLHGFEHLIIDMRGNLGGFPQSFFTYVIGALIDEPLVNHAYYFYRNTPSNNASRLSLRTTPPPVIAFDIADVHNFFDVSVLSDGVLDDLAGFDSVIHHTTRILPQHGRRAPFDPKVWLLTNPDNMSDSQYIASVLQGSGFATLVGDVTGGLAADIRASSSSFALPSTGFIVSYDPFYIIGPDGRPWEDGTVPDYFNRPGMNALETVLAMIAEGEF